MTFRVAVGSNSLSKICIMARAPSCVINNYTSSKQNITEIDFKYYVTSHVKVHTQSEYCLLWYFIYLLGIHKRLTMDKQSSINA